MRSKIILTMALLMGLVTTVLFFNYMKQFKQAETAAATTVSVLAAKQPIAENQLVTSSMLETKAMPETAVHPDSVLTADIAEGKYAAADIAAGEVLLAGRLRAEQEESMMVSRKVREGYRAVGASVNFVGSVSNLIEPDDIVDVVFTETDPVSQELETELLLTNVPVLAIGRRMVESGPNTAYVEYSSVTLELAPADAVRLINADERGTISLALHSRLKEVPSETE